MSTWLLKTLATAVVSFAATNIDDIFVLTFFFAQKNLRGWHVVLGQYLGIAALVAISLAGFFARFIVPETWISLLGLVPILIGVKKLIDLKRGNDDDHTQTRAGSVLTVSAITFANGGDNIAIYVPLFANSDLSSLMLTLLTFAVMIALWCGMGYSIGNHPAVRRAVDRFGHIVVPFVLIALGIYILFS
ncbi:MAG TPA: cadmium resistance transporter [Pyrinomonadaceae bacterium]|nr:cadmium resistance transporter [Pyrinomonadaceae bacterium]